MPKEISLDKMFDHHLGTVEEAVQKIKDWLPKLLASLGEQARGVNPPTWNGNVASFKFSVRGIDVNGTLTVAAHTLRLVGRATNISRLVPQSIIESKLTNKVNEQLRKLEGGG